MAAFNGFSPLSCCRRDYNGLRFHVEVEAKPFVAASLLSGVRLQRCRAELGRISWLPALEELNVTPAVASFLCLAQC